MSARARRVLVVDDDVNMLRVIEGALTDEGLEVQIAPDGERAVALLESQQLPDLLILDVTLPVLDSGRVAARLRERGGEATPVLVITGDGRAQEKARRLGAYSYLRKPFDLGRLVSTVWHGLGR
jgi:CheY-like chemotaxis protein